MKKIEYFYDNGERYIASIDNGFGGFFILIGRDAPKEWKFILPYSLQWDALHQDIYRTHHELSPCPSELISKLPTLPSIPEFTAIEWKDNFLPIDPMKMEDYPKLSALLNDQHETKTFFFVLEEDEYETNFGDGAYRYFEGEVYDSEEECESRKKSDKEALGLKRLASDVNIIRHYKKMSIVADGDELKPIDFIPQKYEDYSIQKIVQRIEEILGSNGKLGWGMPYRII